MLNKLVMVIIECVCNMCNRYVYFFRVVYLGEYFYTIMILRLWGGIKYELVVRVLSLESMVVGCEEELVVKWIREFLGGKDIIERSEFSCGNVWLYSNFLYRL